MRSQDFLGCILAAVSPAAVLAASGSGTSTRYWDCCKPSCAWSGKASLLQGPVTTCDSSDNPLSDPDVRSGCDFGGSAYVCSNTQPWAVNDQVALGFAATAISGGTEETWCCACYRLTFTSGPVQGKTMVVQSINTGGDLSGNQFDLQMPGGGVGIFDGCLSQFGQSLPGAQYGGVSRRDECAEMPELLRDGCYWRFDWFENADNPRHNFEQIQCPSELVAISGCQRSDDGNFPAFEMPEVTEQTSATSAAASETSTAASSGAGTVAQWDQCGGSGWAGSTTCESPYTCVVINQYYSQCQ